MVQHNKAGHNKEEREQASAILTKPGLKELVGWSVRVKFVNFDS